ncbi:MAG: hypothetical protein A2552_10300 [Sulfuricurvum sp. RIFOXYD2_FULL_44_160]|nr:MAG: hypothetical protein A2517_00465 [Sulfuricurvum sp. RIFOXYD12_FULL_44_77]OHD91506.1 MAG: hypothetical protein A2552_10300 [Sulfuricurvum sp. RIFOXYD2_FULL_44_160]
MQRSFSYQNVISRLFLVALFVVYISLSSMYLLLPPLLAILFFFYYDALMKHDLFGLIIISLMLLVFEAEKGFWFGSTIVFFTLLSQYLLPKIEQIIQCKICMAAIMVALAYPGYWLFVWFVNQVLLLNVPAIDWHIGLYMIIEFLVVAALV